MPVQTAREDLTLPSHHRNDRVRRAV